MNVIHDGPGELRIGDALEGMETVGAPDPIGPR
jgi:hypothetical protein